MTFDVYTYDELMLLKDGYKKKSKEEAELVIYEKLRSVVAKELKQFRRCNVCSKVYRVDPKNKADVFCSAECAKKADMQPELPYGEEEK